MMAPIPESGAIPIDLARQLVDNLLRDPTSPIGPTRQYSDWGAEEPDIPGWAWPRWRADVAGDGSPGPRRTLCRCRLRGPTSPLGDLPRPTRQSREVVELADCSLIGPGWYGTVWVGQCPGCGAVAWDAFIALGGPRPGRARP